MVKIGKTKVDMCVLCTSGGTDDLGHTIPYCKALEGLRTERVQRRNIRNRIMKNMVGYMLTRTEAWREMTGWSDYIMSLKTEKERAKRKNMDDPVPCSDPAHGL